MRGHGGRLTRAATPMRRSTGTAGCPPRDWRRPRTEPASGRLAHLRGASSAETVEVEARVVDLEAVLRREPLRDRCDVALADLLDPAAAVACQMVMMLGPAGDV